MHLHRQHRCQSFTRVIAGCRDFGLAHYAFPLHIQIQCSRQGAAKSGQVGAAITLRYVIGKTEDIFLVGIIPLHGDFDTDVILFTDEIEHCRMQRGFLAVQMLDKGTDAALVLEHILLVITLVSDLDAYTRVEE